MQAKAAKVLPKGTAFICSGGVADGKQLIAALALGACGVNVGTRLCVTQEANWPISFKVNEKNKEKRELNFFLFF